jgi:hypothetical protein
MTKKASKKSSAMVTLPSLPKRDTDALVRFWSRYMGSRNRYYKELDIKGDYGLWLAFMETKNQLFRELGGKIPEVYQLKDFWRYVNDLSPDTMEKAILQIKHSEGQL